MTFPAAEILELSETGIKSVSYRDTEHYQLIKQILDNPDGFLKHLLEP